MSGSTNIIIITIHTDHSTLLHCMCESSNWSNARIPCNFSATYVTMFLVLTNFSVNS